MERSRTARMYSLGALLCVTSSWMLLRSLQSKNHSLWPWTGYGLVAAAFLHVHNYAWFTLSAQWLFVISGTVRHLWRGRLGEARRVVLGASWAGFLAGTIYSPWIPAFLGQANRVKEGFWVPPLSLGNTSEVFVAWATGLRYGTVIEAAFALIVLGLIAFGSNLKAHPAAALFLWEAIIPWLWTLVISTVGGRPLLQDRYLVFANASLICFLGAAYACLPNVAWRLILLINVAVVCTFATIEMEYIRWSTASPPSIESAIALLKDNYEQNDVVVVPDARSLNIIRYYASQQGFGGLSVRCQQETHASGHINHISSLAAFDLIWNSDRPPPGVHRIWVVNNAVSLPDSDWSQVLTKSYPPMDKSFESGLSMALYLRQVENPTQ